MDRILAGADFTETDNEPRLSPELVGAVVTPTDDAISTQEMALREGRVREMQLGGRAHARGPPYLSLPLCGQLFSDS